MNCIQVSISITSISNMMSMCILKQIERINQNLKLLTEYCSNENQMLWSRLDLHKKSLTQAEKSWLPV